MNISRKQKKTENVRSSLYIHIHLSFTDINIGILIDIGGVIS